MHHDPVAILRERFLAAMRAALGADLPADADPLITPSRSAEHGDFQSNAPMGLGKRLGKPPRQIAEAIVARLDLTGVAEPLTPASIAGPGFINIRLSPGALAKHLEAIDTPALGVEPPARPQTVVVDLCGVNLAKQMHVGHLRATIIGDALARVFTRLGHKAIRQNHVGDWGLPIAMVAARLLDEQKRGADLSRLTLDDLDGAYRAAQRECEADETGLAAVRRYGLGPKAGAELEAQVGGAEEALARAKRTLINLQSGEKATVAVWQRIADITMAECVRLCARLHAVVLPEHSAGESTFRDELAGIVADLEKRRVAEESKGALIVRLDEYGVKEPLLVRKSDGGFLYATPDHAAIRRRVQKLGAARVVYAVDARQSLHFAQVFAGAKKAGYARRPDGTDASLEHAAFGTVLGEDGRPFKTRSGDNVKLADLLDEAVERADAAVTQRNPHLPPAHRRAIAEAVGVSAGMYADLANDRVRDYVFSFDRMLAFEGDTGPYLLYALVRVRSIFRKAAETLGATEGDLAARRPPLLIREPQEKALALALLRDPEALRAVADRLEPHRLCNYLYDLAGAFSGFFENCPVLKAPDDATRASRLRLCALTGRVLEDGLTTLGLTPVEQM